MDGLVIKPHLLGVVVMVRGRCSRVGNIQENRVLAAAAAVLRIGARGQNTLAIEAYLRQAILCVERRDTGRDPASPDQVGLQKLVPRCSFLELYRRVGIGVADRCWKHTDRVKRQTGEEARLRSAWLPAYRRTQIHTLDLSIVAAANPGGADDADTATHRNYYPAWICIHNRRLRRSSLVKPPGGSLNWCARQFGHAIDPHHYFEKRECKTPLARELPRRREDVKPDVICACNEVRGIEPSQSAANYRNGAGRRSARITGA